MLTMNFIFIVEISFDFNIIIVVSQYPNSEIETLIWNAAAVAEKVTNPAMPNVQPKEEHAQVAGKKIILRRNASLRKQFEWLKKPEIQSKTDTTITMTFSAFSTTKRTKIKSGAKLEVWRPR